MTPPPTPPADGSVGAAVMGVANSLVNIFGEPVNQYGDPLQQPPSSDGIFGLPKTIALVGGLVLVVGIGAYFVTRPRSSYAGYRRRKSRRSRR